MLFYLCATPKLNYNRFDCLDNCSVVVVVEKVNNLYKLYNLICNLLKLEQILKDILKCEDVNEFVLIRSLIWISLGFMFKDYLFISNYYRSRYHPFFDFLDLYFSMDNATLILCLFS